MGKMHLVLSRATQYTITVLLSSDNNMVLARNIDDAMHQHLKVYRYSVTQQLLAYKKTAMQ